LPDNLASYHRTVHKGPSGQPRRALVTAGLFFAWCNKAVKM
jgi:hypothetical protein